MNYVDIISALPKDVADTLQAELDNVNINDTMSQDEVRELADTLQAELDNVNINDTMSQDEVRELAEDAVKLTRLKIVIEDDEKRRLIDTLLSFVAASVVGVVFA